MQERRDVINVLAPGFDADACAAPPNFTKQPKQIFKDNPASHDQVRGETFSVEVCIAA